MHGYLSQEYMKAVGSEEGYVRRPIPGTNYFDEISQYPFYPTTPWLITGVGAVSQTIITNPFCELPLRVENAYPYKTHYVVDLERWSPESMSDNHKKNIKKANNKGCLTFMCPEEDHFDKDCYEIYQSLLAKHEAKGGPSDFSYETMKAMSQVLGSFTFKAIAPCKDSQDYELVGWAMFMCEEEGDCYYHLSASTEAGYKVGSPYALLYNAITTFKKCGGERFLLGSVADGGSPGLAYFKEGWGTHTYKNYIIKRILDRKVYDELSLGKETNFFPAYRG